MQDGDADPSIRIDIWMPNGNLKLERRRSIGILFGESHLALENLSASILCLAKNDMRRGSEGTVSYPKVTILVGTILVKHDETNIPAEDVVFVQVDVDPFLFLQLLQLLHEPCCSAAGLGHGGGCCGVWYVAKGAVVWTSWNENLCQTRSEERSV